MGACQTGPSGMAAGVPAPAALEHEGDPRRQGTAVLAAMITGGAAGMAHLYCSPDTLDTYAKTNMVNFNF